MDNLTFHIVPYAAEYEPALLQLEKNAVQGRIVQLEMLRENYLSRSEVFEEHQIYLALSEAEQLMGVMATAMTPLWLGGRKKRMGVCYDSRVDPAFRGHGITKNLGLHATHHFIVPNGGEGQFLTMKEGNNAVYSASKILGVQLYQYPFMYLTVPTWRRIGKKAVAGAQSRFQVHFEPPPHAPGQFYKLFDSGLGLWHTHLMYRLRIRKMHPALKWGLWLAGQFQKKERRLPGEGEELKFASLFGCTPDNAGMLDELPEYLQHEGIRYLSVCCAKGDFLYKLFRPLAINAYPYILLSTFPTRPEDEIGMDARCM